MVLSLVIHCRKKTKEFVYGNATKKTKIKLISQIFISSNVHCSSLTCTYLNIMTLNGTKLICCYTTYPD
ncbi:hypothetical protein DERF_005138 [Dermatophagoides farinae]|uniref:Uncharacterized protein n=1 Tax=Dermatophagoides farinae TaxID=6954 RepID=A0A922L698_DERFA|nr:hypothetical protein DERF_005138 [Dermatophagoides farinae]